MAETTTVKCETCGDNFERSKFQPYMKECKECRKGKPVVPVKKKAKVVPIEKGKKVKLNQAKVVKQKFQWLADGANNNVKVRACCLE